METELDRALESPVVGNATLEPVATAPISNNTRGDAMKLPVVIGVFVLLVVAGIGTGWGLFMLTGQPASGSRQITAAPGELAADQVVTGQVYGDDDPNRYKDASEGIIASGGIEGEGTHHLLRPGGPTQTVYLTSSVVDLDLFIGHKVQLRGETFSAQKAAWFMDVGSVKVVALNAADADAVDTEDALPSE